MTRGQGRFAIVTRKTGRPVGRPTDPEKVTAILDAGWTLFLERGVTGVTVETIAARAGVSKVTLYKHFPDKASLFEAGVRRECERIEAAQRVGPGQGSAASLEGTLRLFGMGIMEFIVSQGAVDFYNALSGELSRHEELARRFYGMGPGRTHANLSAIIAAGVAAGELAVDDPAEAAEHLFGLWQGFSNFQLSLGIERERVRSSVARRVDRGLAVFIAAYGTAKHGATSPRTC